VESGVWTNFPKTIRTNKIENRAIMLFISTTKTIVGSPVFWTKFGKPITIVMEILMQNHKCNEVENAFPIFKVSRLVRVHTDSHHNKMIFAVSDVWYITRPSTEVLNWCSVFEINFCFFLVQEVNKPSPHLVTVLEVEGYGFSDFTIFRASVACIFIMSRDLDVARDLSHAPFWLVLHFCLE